MLLFDFRDPRSVSEWAPIDDRVMGGISRSRLRHDRQGHAVFEGEVSLAHGGGFASVRCSPAVRGRAGATDCAIEVRGAEGLRFKIVLIADDGFDTVGYQAEFTAGPEDWLVRRLPLASFRATWRGRPVPGAPPLDSARIRQVGLMIAGRQAGPFALDVRGIWLE